MKLFPKSVEAAKMRAEEFLELLRRKPFVPFRVHMTDGHNFEVRHPEMVLVLRSRVEVGVDPDPTTGVLSRVEHCSLLHVVRVEDLPHPLSSVNGPNPGS